MSWDVTNGRYKMVLYWYLARDQEISWHYFFPFLALALLFRKKINAKMINLLLFLILTLILKHQYRNHFPICMIVSFLFPTE